MKKIQTINAKDMNKKDFEDYLKSKPTEFLASLAKTGLKALGSERHQQVKDELIKRDDFMKISKANKDFIKKLAFVLDVSEEDTLNYLIKMGKEWHIKESMKYMKGKWGEQDGKSISLLWRTYW